MMFQTFSSGFLSSSRLVSFATVLALCSLVSAAVYAADEPEEKERINYTCKDDSKITAIYYGVPEDAGAELQIDDRYFSFYSIPAKGGEKYATDQGLEEGTGLLWLRNESGATALFEMSLDESVNPKDYPMITTCSVSSSQP